MDYQVLFNIAVGVAGAFGGWMLNSLTRAIERLDEDIRSLPHDYVTKDDYRQDVRELKDMVRQLFDKLDGKADKGAHHV